MHRLLTKAPILQSRVYKNKIFCIFHIADYGYFTKMYYLCTKFQSGAFRFRTQTPKRLQNYNKFLILTNKFLKL